MTTNFKTMSAPARGGDVVGDYKNFRMKMQSGQTVRLTIFLFFFKTDGLARWACARTVSLFADNKDHCHCVQQMSADSREVHAYIDKDG